MTTKTKMTWVVLKNHPPRNLDESSFQLVTETHHVRMRWDMERFALQSLSAIVAAVDAVTACFESSFVKCRRQKSSRIGSV